MSEKDKERSLWKQAIDLQNYELCELAYREAGRPMWHREHMHTGRSPKVKPWHIRDDLAFNGCRRILGPYWADY